jgi:hypothetical protein
MKRHERHDIYDIYVRNLNENRPNESTIYFVFWCVVYGVFFVLSIVFLMQCVVWFLEHSSY